MTQQGPPLESMYDAPGPPGSAPDSGPPPDNQPQPVRPQPEPLTQSPLDRQADPFPQEFPQGHQEPFRGLLLLGKLDHWFTWVGHRFHIQTCKPDVLVEAAAWAAEYRDTDGYVKALQAATIAACLVTVDGEQLPVVPLTPDRSFVGENARWVLANWFPPLLDKVHEEYVLLEIQAREILADMEKASG